MTELRLPKQARVKQKPPSRRMFAVIPIRALEDRRLTDGAVRTLAKVCSWANRAGITWVTQQRIAEESGIRRQAVNKHVKQLKDHGYIEVIRKGFKGYTGDTIRVIYDPQIGTLDAIAVASTTEDARPPFLKELEEKMQSIPPKKQQQMITEMLAGIVKPVVNQQPTRRYTMPKGETLAVKRIREGLKKRPHRQPESGECEDAQKIGNRPTEGCAITLKAKGYEVTTECEGLIQVVDQYVHVDRIGALIDEVLDRHKAEGLPPPRLASLLESVINLNADRIVDGVYDTAQNAPGSPTAHDRGQG